MPAPKPTRREKRPQAGALARSRRRICHYCSEKIDDVDYKASTVLRRFVSDKGTIRSRRVTGACRRHQRQVAVAVKRAREMALLPYADR
jgi:small subunit ribosomal protein S18